MIADCITRCSRRSTDNFFEIHGNFFKMSTVFCIEEKWRMDAAILHFSLFQVLEIRGPGRHKSRIVDPLVPASSDRGILKVRFKYRVFRGPEIQAKGQAFPLT